MAAMSYESNAVFWVEVEKIVPNPFQPRREFDEEKLNELAESIRTYGVLQPLTVTRVEVPLEDGAFRNEYELIAGERRLRASKIAGLSQVPVLIRAGKETQRVKLELAIIENLQREDLNPVDRALAFRQLADQFTLSHANIARKVGRSREYVSNTLRLLLLPETVLNALRVGDVTDGHARTLLMLNDRPEEQDVVFREILLKKLSVREVERIVRKIAQDKVRKRKWKDTDPELIDIERKFTETLGTRVQIAKTEYGGRLMIDYFSTNDLDTLLAMVHTAQHISSSASDTAPPAHDAGAPCAHPTDEAPPHTHHTPADDVSPAGGEHEHRVKEKGEEVVAPSPTPGMSEEAHQRAREAGGKEHAPVHENNQRAREKKHEDDARLYSVTHFSI